MISGVNSCFQNLGSDGFSQIRSPASAHTSRLDGWCSKATVAPPSLIRNLYLSCSRCVGPIGYVKVDLITRAACQVSLISLLISLQINSYDIVGVE